MAKKPRNPTHLEIGARIRAAREAKRWKLKDLTEATHGALAENRISNYENGIRGPDAAVCKLLAEVLEVNFHWLRFGDEPREIRKSQENYSPYGVAETGMQYAVPVIEWKDVKADLLMETQSQSYFAIRHGPRAYALTIEKEDMSSEYRVGDYILVDPDEPPVDGDDVIAIGADGAAVVRRIHDGRDGGVLTALDSSGRYIASSHAEKYAVVGTIICRIRRRSKALKG